VKVIAIGQAKLEDCIKAAQQERVVLTRGGKPVAVLVGVTDLDLEQIELGYSDRFWKLIQQRRQEKTLSREELEERLTDKAGGKQRSPMK
jgi:prevent-host-death family protein